MNDAETHGERLTLRDVRWLVILVSLTFAAIGTMTGHEIGYWRARAEHRDLAARPGCTVVIDDPSWRAIVIDDSTDQDPPADALETLYQMCLP